MSSLKNRKCRLCPTMIRRDVQSGLCIDCYNKERAAAVPSARLQADREKQRLSGELATTRLKYGAALEQIKTLEKRLDIIRGMGEDPVETFEIKPALASGTAEGTVALVASDWHVEEKVDPATVSYLNTFSLDLAKTRAERFFASGLRLTKLLQQDIKVKTMILALLGDFISNELHDAASAEVNALQPMLAVKFAKDLIASGIEHLLEYSDLELLIPCHSGNHARTTRKTRFAAENGHSLEYLMFLMLADYFRSEKRVKFMIGDGYHSYVAIYDQVVRFHHGHAINYQGGIGGIFIPAFKAISQWDKARRADLDVFGHFHQMKDGGKFICNGSLIGYNAFGLSIKADYERPQQTLFLMDKNRGRTCTWPILLEKKEAK